MTSRDHLKQTIALAVPVAIGQIGQVLLGVTDSLMVGRLGSEHLAAASLGNSIFLLLLVLAVGIAAAITPLVAIASGENKPGECAIILRQGMLTNIGVSILLTVTALLLANFLSYLNQPPGVVTLATPYLRIMGFAFVPMLVFFSARNFIEGLSFTRPAMVIMLTANIVNVFGNWVLIYGNLGFPALGLNGAGYSSLLVEIFIAVAIIIYLHRSSRFDAYRPLFHYRKLRWDVIRRLLSVGVPSGMQFLFEAGSFSFAAIMIGWLGSKYLAAHQIAISLASISFMFILGIAHASTIRVGNALGRGDAVAIRRAGFTSIALSAGVMSIFGLIFVIFRHHLPWLYNSDPEVIPIASSLLIIAAIFQISDGVQAVGMGVLRGLTDVKIPMFIAIIAYWIVGVPTGYILCFKFGLGAQGVWLGLLFGLTTAGILFTLRFRRRSTEMIKEAAMMLREST